MFGAGITADGTAGVKAAAGGIFLGLDCFTGKNDALSLIVRVRNRYIGQQCFEIRVARFLYDRFGRQKDRIGRSIFANSLVTPPD